MSEVEFECAECINPVEPFLRTDRMPHIWCPGCGIGTTVNCFTRALHRFQGSTWTSWPSSPGIGCTGRVAGYLKLDSFHTTHGRAIPFATGLKLANPDLKVVVYSGDGDLLGHRRQPPDPRRAPQHRPEGHLRQQLDLRHDRRPDCAHHARARHHLHHALRQRSSRRSTCRTWWTPAGAVYVARWTTFHVRQVARSMQRGLQEEGLLLHRDHLALPHALPAPQQAWATASTP